MASRLIRRIWLAALLAGFLSLAAFTVTGWSASARAENSDAGAQDELPAYDARSMLVGLPPHVDPHTLTELFAGQQMELVRYWPDLDIAHVRLIPDLVLPADQSLEDFASRRRAALAENDLFRFVEFDGVVRIAAVTDMPPDLEPVPNDPLVDVQYALDVIRAREAWNITRGDPAVAVAVIDTGYAANHEDIDFANVWRNEAEFNGFPNIDDDANGYIDDIIGWNWFDNNNNPEDGNGHGTHIFGTVVATSNNSIGVAGMGRAVRASPLRIFGPSGTGSISNLVAAIDYAVQQKFPIINLSLTTSSDSPALREAITRAADEGALVIAAGGNMAVGSSFTAVQYPALYPTTLAVAATNAADEWAPFSRHGPAIDVAAPGNQIWSTYIDPRNPAATDVYHRLSGTSMSTAHVSALAALIFSLRPDLTAADVRDLILATAQDVNQDQLPGKDNFLGHGRMDMAAALLEASRGLTITSDGFGFSPGDSAQGASTAGIVRAQNGEARVRVTAPGTAATPESRIPVHNAILHYRLHGDGGQPTSEWQRTATDADGFASLPVPMSDSTHFVDLQVGAIARTVQVAFLPEDTRLQLDLETDTAVAGSAPISYTLSLRDADDKVITASISVEIVTTLGTFEDLAPATTVNLEQGTYTGAFRPGAASGSAVLTATAGPYATSGMLEVLADKPAAIEGPNKLFPEVSMAANSVLLQFAVVDRFGNLVRDGTEVSFFSSLGKPAVASIQTVNGRGEVAVALPTPQRHPVAVWVVIPDGPLEIRVDIPAVRVRAWMPLIHIESILAQP